MLAWPPESAAMLSEQLMARVHCHGVCMPACGYPIAMLPLSRCKIYCVYYGFLVENNRQLRNSATDAAHDRR